MSPSHRSDVRPPAERVVDPAAGKGKALYQGLSASSVGLELGIAVTLGVLAGLWLDDQFGTSPLLLLLFIAFGLIAGFRGVLRAVAREDRRAAAPTASEETRRDG